MRSLKIWKGTKDPTVRRMVQCHPEVEQGNFMIMTDQQILKFWSHIKQGPVDQCWPWLRCFQNKGYGVQWVSSGRQMLSHRLAWIFTFGEIPEGMCVLHKCDNPPCCNPEHLFLGTHHENMLDREVKGHGRRRALTKRQFLQAKLLLGSDVRVSEIAKKFNARRNVIYNIKNGHLKYL